ncbi:MAG: cobyric acid synthase CobQ [Frankiales bacterium]|nr:cobyric acid synthase CobQ [Frankiales bacterium]
MKGALLVAGTTSDAGKSVLTAALCRWLARRGVSVAPFKAQNMSNNSAVTRDGGEIGRAQAMQARACGIEPTVAMNPVLLKPGSDRRSHVLLRGHPYGEATAANFVELRTALREQVLASFDELRAQFDVVICEGAGSPAEINLRAGDLANMWLADQRELPTVVVGDIDRGGMLAAAFGTLALLSPRDQSLISGFVVNKFRGDAGLLQPGLDLLTRLTGRPVLGVFPWLPNLLVDTEDSLSVRDSFRPSGTAAARPGKDTADSTGIGGGEELSVVAVRLPRMSNTTDVEAIGYEPGVHVRWVTAPAELAAADLVVVPGSRATVADLSWLRERGLAEVLVDRAAQGRPVLGICGGYQMLARTITDEVESGAGTVPGLGLLPTTVRFERRKIVRQARGTSHGHVVDTAYEIHHGQVSLDHAGPIDFLDGFQVGAVWGTTWHGAWDSDNFRQAFLNEVAVLAGRSWRATPGVRVAELRQASFDRLADGVAEHLDTDLIDQLIAGGPTRGLPFVPPGAPE